MFGIAFRTIAIKVADWVGPVHAALAGLTKG
jgi:hypothetical protein